MDHAERETDRSMITVPLAQNFLMSIPVFFFTDTLIVGKLRLRSCRTVSLSPTPSALQLSGRPGIFIGSKIEISVKWTTASR